MGWLYVQVHIKKLKLLVQLIHGVRDSVWQRLAGQLAIFHYGNHDVAFPW